MKEDIPDQKLSPDEESLDKSLGCGEWKGVMTPAMKEELEQAAENALAERGGARPGAGRPPKDYIKTNLLLSPAARKKLEKLKKETGSLSEAANVLILR